MLKNLWYVVAPSSDVRAQPVKASIIGQDFVVFRNAAGEAAVLSDICIHRGGSLSDGEMADGAVACPYHGWRFDADGACIYIPAQPDAVIPQRARIDAYPTLERYGWIWAFLGDLPDAERPPLPDLSWIDDPAFRLVYGHYDWDVSWERVMENGLDFAHTPFVHGTTFGDRQNPAMDDFIVTQSTWGGDAQMGMRAPPPRIGTMRWRHGKERVPVTANPGYHFSGPCVTLYLRPRGNWAINLVAAHVPIDENRTRTWWVMGRNFMKLPLFDKRTSQRNLTVFYQDHAVLRHVRPERAPESWLEEVTVKSDGLQVAFRRKLRELEGLGWRIDTERIAREFQGKRACVIPCPARNAHDPHDGKSWVYAPAPTVAP